MKRLAAMAGVLALLLVPGASAAPRVAPPAGDISDNVQFVTNLPEMKAAIAVNFIGDTMFISTVHGLYSYDVSDPAAPSLLGALPMYIWENEDMDVDAERNLVFISRDPRGFTSPATTAFPYGAIHVIDVSSPQAMTPIGFVTLPAGHTTTCVNDCQALWTGGPAVSPLNPADWAGRPIFATDVTDPANPVVCPEPIDIGRNDGITDYAHDVQVDAQGVAWVSGAGGVRGYWTEGKHKNPVTGKVEKATACKPVPYGGGGTPKESTPSRFMHNSWRNTTLSIPGESRSKGMVLFGTEENTVTACEESGRFASYDIRGSLHGEGWKNIDKTHFRMRVLDTWTPAQEKGATGCDSAHYFSDRGDGVLAYAFYSQGTRFIDASDPTDLRQIGYFRPDDANTWAAYWHDGYVFVADFTRGIDVLTFEGGPGSEPMGLRTPPVAPAPEFSHLFRGLCVVRPDSIR
jgi:hypothetical protein